MDIKFKILLKNNRLYRIDWENPKMCKFDRCYRLNETGFGGQERVQHWVNKNRIINSEKMIG
jgi:hypothetical protein